ncbi:MAG: hypothetical protein ACRDT2_07580 [Natronosporangium sp.]
MIHNDATAVAVAEALARVEAADHTQGWDIEPILIGLFTRPGERPNGLLIEVDPGLFGPAIWHQSDPANPGHSLPMATVLDLMVRTVSAADQRTGFHDWLNPRSRTFLGFALLFVGWKTTPYHGYRHGDLNNVPAMAEVEVRVVAGLDLAGRYYQIHRGRGETVTAAAVIDPAPADLAHTNVGAALTRLVNLARTTGHHATGHHANDHYPNGRGDQRP